MTELSNETYETLLGSVVCTQVAASSQVVGMAFAQSRAEPAFPVKDGPEFKKY